MLRASKLPRLLLLSLGLLLTIIGLSLSWRLIIELIGLLIFLLGIAMLFTAIKRMAHR